MRTNGLLFDFTGTLMVFEKFNTKDSCNIILTDTLFAAFEKDNRPHIRASIYSKLSIVSVPGIVEGPAKPKGFYVYKQRYTTLGVWELKEHQIKKKYKGKFIDYNDRRLTEVVKGYIAQAVFFYMTGYPFCDKKSCRLYNAHWQEDVIRAQITSGKFCALHQKILKKL